MITNLEIFEGLAQLDVHYLEEGHRCTPAVSLVKKFIEKKKLTEQEQVIMDKVKVYWKNLSVAQLKKASEKLKKKQEEDRLAKDAKLSKALQKFEKLGLTAEDLKLIVEFVQC